MSIDELLTDDGKQSTPLTVLPPFIWPEPRIYAGLAHYAGLPPSKELFADADLISCLLVGAGEGTIQWLDELLGKEGNRRVCVVLVLFPAGPTREEHLREIDKLRIAHAKGEKILEVRVMPMADHLGGDCKRANLPPTVLQAHNTKTGQTVMSIGSVGDAGCDNILLGSLNLVFHLDDALRDAWRRWFQYVFTKAAPLKEGTLQIPYLVPAKGDPEAARQWEAFELACQELSSGGPSPTVDPETGEVKSDADGRVVMPWDEGKTALDPLARAFHQVYSNGWLVTIDEASRIKPLTIPVKATLLGQKSERTIGALKQKQSFSLRVLDDSVDKAIEKCRKVTDVVELLSYPLSQGNRWLPEGAKGLLERELESRNEQGKKALRDALGGNDIKQFIANRNASIRKDLNEMYRQLGQGDAVPNEKLKAVLDDIEQRLTQALNTRITPRAVYNRIGAPDLTANAPDENWNQPLSLLVRSTRILRESLTNSYFPRRFTGLSFSEDDFRNACNVFGDAIVADKKTKRAKDELLVIDKIQDDRKPAKEKCQQLWQLLRGASAEEAGI